MLTLVLALLASPAHASCNGNQTLTQATSGETRENDDRFGDALTTGDFDGDGYDDLAIGSPWEDWDGQANAGIVIIHYGTGSGLGSSAWSRWSQKTVSGASNEAGDLFASVLAAGDLDGDGYDDLVLGTPNEDHDGFTDTGRISVRYGTSSGVTSSGPSESWGQDDVAGNGEADGDRFGHALAVGDFDGDGYDDVAIGAPEDDIGSATGAGRVVIMYGSSGGLTGSSSEAFNQNNFGLTPEAGDDFGAALAAGDFNGDGYDDLAIGAPNEDHSSATNPGQVMIKFGSASGLKSSTQLAYFAAVAIGAVARDYDRLGSNLAAGDIDGDGYDDLLLGIPEKNVNGTDNVGLVGLSYGGPGTSIVSNGTHIFSTDVGQSETLGNNWGNDVHAADLDNDGYDDVIVGAPRVSGREGRIGILFGGSTGVTTTTRLFTETCMGGSATNDQYFGQVLTAGDYDGDGVNELAAGDYNHTPNTYGAVFVSEIR